MPGECRAYRFIEGQGGVSCVLNEDHASRHRSFFGATWDHKEETYSLAELGVTEEYIVDLSKLQTGRWFRFGNTEIKLDPFDTYPVIRVRDYQPQGEEVADQ